MPLHPSQIESPLAGADVKEPVTILMVDDQPAKLLSYEVILHDLGERMLKASSGREALEHLLKSDVAVVLMDVSMPEIDGFELADMMRKHPRFQKTPIIFVSAVHLSEVDLIRGYESGAVDYISVPVIPEVLRAKVSVFAELHRKTRALQTLNRDLEHRVAQRSEELRVLNEQLQQRVAELESIMQVLPVGVAVSQDPEARQIVRNSALLHMLGVDGGADATLPSTELGVQFIEKGRFLTEGELPIQRTLAKGSGTGALELEVVRANDGVRGHILTSASPLFDSNGSIRGAVAAFFDLTERKQMEDALRERAELLELASEAIMVRDGDGTVRFWNAGAEALYGWTREEALGTNVHHLLATDLPGGVSVMANALKITGRWAGNLKHRRKDGTEVLVASRQAVQSDGSVILEINRDITAQVVAEEALRRNERLAAMGKLAGIVAHEINNPLEAITNTFYLLRQHSSLDADALRYAELADQELARVCHITRQTLSFYRESQQPVPVSLAELFEDVLELQERLFAGNHIHLVRRFRSKGLIHGFPSELKQVFINLISNSVQAMPNGGELRISLYEVAARGGRQIRIHVSDNGSGITPQTAKKLFEPFFTTKSTKGTGLGLWISRGIVEKHEGSLKFRSIFGSKGTVTSFQITFPVV